MGRSDREDRDDARAEEDEATELEADAELEYEQPLNLFDRAQQLVDELRVRADGLAQGVDDVTAIAAVLGDVAEIAFSETVMVIEERCVRCGGLFGQPHRRMACGATARLRRIRELLAGLSGAYA
jgi:hypothetical protein